MATSNVEFYQKQKDLQDSMIENEQKRKKLEAQLQAYCQSDQKLAKLRAGKLQSYWKRICEEEKSSKQRNVQLLRDLDRMEANMATLDARREKLKHMKQQYFDYVERTYPKWLELVQQKKVEYIQEQQQKQQQQYQEQQQYDQVQYQQQQQYNMQSQYQQQQQTGYSPAPTSAGNQSSQQQYTTGAQQQYSGSQQQYTAGAQQHYSGAQQQYSGSHQQSTSGAQQQYSGAQQQYSGAQHSNQNSPAIQRSADQTLPKQQEAFLAQDQYMGGHRNQYQDEDDEYMYDEVPPLPESSPPPPPAAFTGELDMGYTGEQDRGYSEEQDRGYTGEQEREYTNLKDVRRDTDDASPKPQMQPIPSVTVHMPSMQGESGSPNKGSRPNSGRNWLAAERDTSIHSASYSEEVEVPISQPVQSVTVRKASEPPKPVVQMMDPVSDEDVSDFGEEPDLPSGAGPTPDIQPGKPPSPAGADDEEEEDSDQTPSVVHPDVSISGLLHLMKCVEEDIQTALGLDGFYRTRSPDELYRREIIHKANSMSSLKNLDGELVSMIVLQQLTLVVRRLPGACMLSDTLLVRGEATLTEAEIRENLHRDAQSLWDKLLEHFVMLVKSRVMGTREVAHVFVPCLVHATSHNHEMAVSVIECVIETIISRTEGRTSPIQQDSTTIDTARSSQQGGVPPLKFGSLVDSKPYTDDESSMITQSITTDIGPKVPLNETDAYKNLISGTKPVQTVSHDDTDTSDNDLEKQLVSALSPRSHGSKSYPEHAVNSSVPVDESHGIAHDESHDPEPRSELSESPVDSPVYVPTGVDRNSTIKSNLGSTGGSSQQKRLAGMIGSDLDDSDTESGMVAQLSQKKDDDDDDDFYDFYG